MSRAPSSAPAAAHKAHTGVDATQDRGITASWVQFGGEPGNDGGAATGSNSVQRQRGPQNQPSWIDAKAFERNESKGGCA